MLFRSLGDDRVLEVCRCRQTSRTLSSPRGGQRQRLRSGNGARRRGAVRLAAITGKRRSRTGEESILRRPGLDWTGLDSPLVLLLLLPVLTARLTASPLLAPLPLLTLCPFPSIGGDRVLEGCLHHATHLVQDLCPCPGSLRLLLSPLPAILQARLGEQGVQPAHLVVEGQEGAGAPPLRRTL